MLVPGDCVDIIGGALDVSPFGKLPFSFSRSRACDPLVKMLFNLEGPMTPCKTKNGKMPVVVETLPVLHAHAAGIDLHARAHWVAVPPGSAPAPAADHPANLPAHIRKFGTCTADLEALADWLTVCKVTTVAMESTGIYWVPLFELLERRGFQVSLIDPRQTKHVPGRPKSDVLDCQWIQRLHSCGLLSASFRPNDEMVELRGYMRQRLMLLEYGSCHIQHMQKALELMNVKLPEVVKDITGVTGMAIIKAILRGERDPLKLAARRNSRCKRTEAEIARALYGNWRAEHLFALEQAVNLYETYQRLLRDCDGKLEAVLQGFADKSGGQVPPRKRQRQKNEPTFAVASLLQRMSGVNLLVIEGISDSTALVVLSEIGCDMSKWRTEKHFTSWLGLCPQHRSTGGKISSRRVRRGANRAARALRMAAQGCHRARNALGAFYRRIQARSGGAKAVVATARKLAERIYRLLKYGEEYVRQGIDQYEAKYRSRQIEGLKRKARDLGFELMAQATSPMPATP
jgi:transposase